MKVLFVSSGNRTNGMPSVLIQNQAKSLESFANVDFHVINSPGTWGYFKHIFLLALKIRKSNPDIIHAHYSYCGFVSYFAKIASLKPIKLVVSLMGSDVYRKSSAKFFLHYFIRKKWNNTIVKTHVMKDMIGLENVIVVPNGVDLSISQYKSDIKFNSVIFPADPSRISKNFSLADQAMKEVLKQRPEIQFEVVYGLSHSEILQKIASSSVVILTSHWEGSPNIVKESMVLNRPVVSTAVGDVEYLFGNTPGYFISSNNPNEIALNIQKAIDFSKIQIETTGKDRIVLLALDSQSIAKKIVEVYVS